MHNDNASLISYYGHREDALQSICIVLFILLLLSLAGLAWCFFQFEYIEQKRQLEYELLPRTMICFDSAGAPISGLDTSDRFARCAKVKYYPLED